MLYTLVIQTSENEVYLTGVQRVQMKSPKIIFKKIKTKT